ncbi:TetR-like C-terminal domain-containing protein [Streptomyces sp. CBMA152]|uniref:TetR-like C-terminal domain-containing protein n=1 Tax=Streptomyces sp. CBMA152 TaxID=1896312 RepID=UPI00166091B1|nr:TetR-like C-terminal domain-containing protein [Streptomyces sp. CBMA152]MBD0742157.1 hypothetical protein [Streptomyces sp. CBMA152]
MDLSRVYGRAREALSARLDRGRRRAPLRVWGRLHGLVSLEVYGHLAPETDDPGRVFEDEIWDLTRTLGLEG